jgi:diaminopimelate decarboxylase
MMDPVEKTVRDFFRRGDKYLRLLRARKKPLYVFERGVMRRRALAFRGAFESVLDDSAFFFAVKCNSHPDVAKTALAAGYGLDVSSGEEFKAALSLGAKEIVFSGPGKTEDELRLAAENSGRMTLLADSLSEIGKADAAARTLNTKIKTGIRLTVSDDVLWRKFGIPPESLPEFWRAVKTKRNLQFCGLQFHTSWNLTPDAQIKFIEKLGAVIKTMPAEFKRAVNFLDIGGGYWPPRGEWLLNHGGVPGSNVKPWLIKPVASITIFAESINRALKKHIFPELKCRICFEPGRWLCNDAVQLLMSVSDKKSEDIAITDAATNAVGWERFEHDYFPVLNLSRPAFREFPCNVLGSLCTPHDVWGRGCWGNGIEPGDVLLIPMQGAYTYSLRQHFIKPLPDFVTV